MNGPDTEMFGKTHDTCKGIVVTDQVEASLKH